MRTIDDVKREMEERAARIANPHPGEGWKCKKCGTWLEQCTGYASVHDGPFPLSGSGRVLHYAYPYCPTCEPNPGNPSTFVDTEERLH